jgi:intracellular septation protein A
MMNILRKLLVSFLSIMCFFAAFVVAGDVLIAAVTAIAVAIAQMVLAWSTHQRAGVMTWASLALVLALTGTTLVGEDVDAALPSGVTPVNCMTMHCACEMELPV